MPSSTSQLAPTQRIPAWKRLGLQLKGPASGGSPTPAHAPQTSAQPSGPDGSHVNGSSASTPTWNNKRKQSSSVVPTGSDTKKARTDVEWPPPTTGALKRRKSVTFTDDTKPEEPHPPLSTAREVRKRQAKQKQKAKRQRKKAQAPPSKGADPNLQPSLIYLRQWKSDKDSWKFNKNHQTLLLKYLFSCSVNANTFLIPTEDTDALYDYIRDLKGSVRVRLREQAEELRRVDMEQGKSTFDVAAGVAATKRVAERDSTKMQAEYELLVSSMTQNRTTNPSSNGVNANGKRARRISEVDYVLRAADPDVQRRLIKRIRAENILDELSDSETSCASTETATTGSSSQEMADAGADKRVRLNDGSQQKLRRKRKRKSRDAMMDGDDTSSSEPDTDDEASSTASSSTSASSSSSESSDDETPLLSVPGRDDLDTSSSSSSSSSGGEYDTDSEDGTDEDEDGEDEDESDEEEL